MKCLDRSGRFLYKPGLVILAALGAAAVVFGPATTRAGELVLGVEMPKKAIPDGPFRYVATGTLRDVSANPVQMSSDPA